MSVHAPLGRTPHLRYALAMMDATAGHIPRDRSETLPLPPARVITTPALISDAISPLAGTTLLALLLRSIPDDD